MDDIDTNRHLAPKLPPLNLTSKQSKKLSRSLTERHWTSNAHRVGAHHSMNDGNTRRMGTLTQEEVSRRVRRAVRGFEPPKAATRQLWRRNASLWHHQHTHDQFVAPPSREVEQQLVEWFDALKLKHTGKVEATEMRALLEAVGVQAAVPPGDELTLSEFVKCGRAMFRDYAADDEEGDGGITTDHASLAMMSYRRQRMLSDMRDPKKRARLALAQTPVETRRRWSALVPPPLVDQRATNTTVISGAGRRRLAMHNGAGSGALL